MIIDADLSQIEVRVCAFLSQDKTMIEEIKAGIDMHKANCINMLELPFTKENRNHAKTAIFRII